jgi:hypothetical protein
MGDIINLKSHTKARDRDADGWTPAEDCAFSVNTEDGHVVLTLEAPDVTVAVSFSPGFAMKLSRLLFSAASSLVPGVR